MRKKRTKSIAGADWHVTAQLKRGAHVIAETGPLPISDAHLNTQYYEAGLTLAQFLDEAARKFLKTQAGQRKRR